MHEAALAPTPRGSPARARTHVASGHFAAVLISAFLVSGCASTHRAVPAGELQSPSGGPQSPSGAPQSPGGGLQSLSGAPQSPSGGLQSLSGAPQSPSGGPQSPSGGPPSPRTDLSPTPDFGPATLYVARRRWHIDVGFDAGALRQPLAGVLRGFPHAKYAFFGFGDRHYLLAKDHDAPVLLAALWPGPGLILLTTLEDTPRSAFGAGEIAELPLTAEQSRAVQGFIWRSLARRGTEAQPLAAMGPYIGSAYFAAEPRYSALHTCITWAAEALAAGGFPIRARVTIVAGQLWRQVRKLGASEGAPSRGAASPRVDPAPS